VLFNHFTLAARNLSKHKSNTFISMFGLLGGISSALVLLLYANQELTFDAAHLKRENIFAVYKERMTPTGNQTVYGTWVPMLQAMKDEYPDIKNGVRTFDQQGFLAIDDKQFAEQVTFADPSLFSIFNLPLEHGDGVKLLQNKSAVILSRETASRFFGDEDVIGKPIRLMMNGTLFDLTVAAVMEPVPSNSTIRPEIVISFENAMDIAWVRDAGWDDAWLMTYIQTNTPSDAAKLETLFPAFVKKFYDEETATRMKFKLMPLRDFHDALTHSRRAAYVMICIAFIIVLIAVVNYINLSTVRSIERAKEIGLRKALGASRGSLIRQFLSESLVLTTAAFAGACILLQASLPFINQFLETTIDLEVLTTPRVLFMLFVVFLLVGLSSGSFPAFFISRFKTIESIKGKLKNTATGARLKGALIVLQFSLSAILFFSTLVIYHQVKFMKTHDLGLNKENVLVIRTDTDNMMDPEGARVRVTSVKRELLQDSRITAVAASAIVPSDVSTAGFTMTRPDGWTEDQPFRIMRVYVDESFFKLYDVKFIAGENFHEDISPLDTMVRNFAIINEAAMKAFGWKDIEGKKAGRRTMVVGVVKDHHYDNLSRAIEPIMFVYRTTENQSSTFLSLKIAGDPSDVLPLIESKWKTIDPTRPFSYFFVDANFESLYRSEERNMTLITWFSALAIVIACMGLWGLISFTVTQKVKEIGIRKVLGSSVRGIVVLLNREFLILISVALAIAMPLGYFAMNSWLADFAVRIDIPWSTFTIVAGVIIAVALITTTLRIWRAANINPADSLRSE
jgi:putative ABC transport system permease protein